MSDQEKPLSRQAARNRARREGKPAAQPAAPTLSRTEMWAARGRHNLALQQMAASAVELDLPSGLTVTARRLPVSALFELGQIPNALLPIVSDWFDQFQQFPDDVDARADALTQYANSPEREADTRKILRMVWLKGVIDPVFVEAEQHGQTVLVLQDEPDLPVVHESDLIFYFEWAQGVTESARDWFLSRSAPGVSALPASEEGRDEPGAVPGAAAGPVAGLPVE